MKALLVGGTGPTGPLIAHGLAARGYEVTLLHRGLHEVPEVAQFDHIHVDPHFTEGVADALGSERYEVAIIAYGRLRRVFPIVAERSQRVVSVGGTAYGRQEITRPLTEDATRDTSDRLIARIQQTEDEVFEIAERLGTPLTHIRYPYLYGPRQLAPREWSIIRRILDGRRAIPVVDGGLSRESRAFADNAAHGVLLAVDTPAAAGRIYHVADEVTPTDGERAHAIAQVMGAEIELIDYPRTSPQVARFWFAARTLGVQEDQFPVTDHTELDLTLARTRLGYKDVVPFEEAIERTVAWYLEHPLELGGDDEARLGDNFDYEAEDAFAAALARFTSEVAGISVRESPIRHAYDHPVVGSQEAP